METGIYITANIIYLVQKLHAMKKVWGMCSEFNISCGRGQGVLVASPLQEVCITKCGRV